MRTYKAISGNVMRQSIQAEKAMDDLKKELAANPNYDCVFIQDSVIVTPKKAVS